MKFFLKDNVTGEQTKNIFSYKIKKETIEFSFKIFTNKIFCPFANDNQALYDGDVVEVFITKNEDVSKYYEMEIAPNGARFFANISNDNATDKFNGDLLKVDLISGIFIKSRVKIKNYGYTTKIIFPNNKIDLQKSYFNAYLIDNSKPQPLFSISPTKCNFFHKPKAFIKLK